MYKLTAMMVFVASSFAHAVDRPDLSVPFGAAKLEIKFSDENKWNGKRIPLTLQCEKRGGVKPVRSPELKVLNAPLGTQKLVVFFNEPRAFNNQGLFSYEGTVIDGVYTIPAVGSGSKNLPQGIELFQGGSSRGAGYNSPCPMMSMQHFFAVTVFALNDSGAVIAKGETDLGYAE